MPRLGNVAFDRARAAVRIRAARRSISRVTHASKGLLSSADARHGHRAPAPRGACRFVARRLPQWMFNPGLRPSHVALRLDRHAHSGFPDAERRCFVKALQTIVPRLRKNQLVSALTVVARERISGSVLSSLLGHLQKPSCVHVLWQQPRKVAALVHQFSRPLGEPRDNVTLSTLQYIAKQLVVHADEFGEGGVIVFDSLARASGPVAFRRLLGDDMKQLITSIMSRAGISSDPCTVQMIGVGEQRISSVTVGVDLLCTVGRAGRQNTQLVATLCEYICDHIFVLDISRLPALAQCVCLGGQKDGGNQHDEFVLLHAICRRSLSHPQALSDDDLIILLQAFARADLFEEEFLEVVSCRICQGARQLHAGKLADTISCLGSLQVRDVQLLDALCSGVSSQVQDLQELDIVRCFRGLVRLRHTDHGILHALMPEVDRRKWLLTPLSLTNIISSLAFFGVMGEQFFAGMLGVVSSRISRLSSTSVQHVLTTLCREQGRMRNELLQEPMMAVCEFLATPTVAAQLTPVQAVGALSALAKLQCRNLSALSVLLSSLVGRGTNVVWTWAPSTNFYAHGRPGGSSPSAPFDEVSVADATAAVASV
eukprot:TRINITY_DN7316_c0_g1_i1.p1 TRINITY_DN7316_c0_g1~~TRINITY_DN7316_c0_g1_i1.p1  ORF type:complete len:598 (-),score=68.31 TRINITY_DN7316_c0_g1_i1:453-2246(-)